MLKISKLHLTIHDLKFLLRIIILDYHNSLTCKFNLISKHEKAGPIKKSL